MASCPWPNVTTITHPVIQERLTVMRDRNTDVPQFRRLIGQIAPSLLESPADTLDEEWEEVGADATTGELYFLQGERLLRVGYLASSTDANGAVKLARLAMRRLTADKAEAR